MVLWRLKTFKFGIFKRPITHSCAITHNSDKLSQKSTTWFETPDDEFAHFKALLDEWTEYKGEKFWVA